MRFLEVTLPTPPENLAVDEALLLEADAGRASETLRLWQWPEPAVVLGAGCRMREDVNEPVCRADGVPILRRASGGGTVLLGAGCLCYSLVLAYDRAPELQSIPSSYAYILRRIGGVLAGMVPGIEPAGTSDLALGGRKFSGNSQQRKRRYLLHHGTLLYRFDSAAVERYLRLPMRQPDYRRERDHTAFLMNLPLAPDRLRAALREAWDAYEERSDWPANAVRRLVAEKYLDPKWIARR
jgi:lipoate-protein ligase A